MTTPTISPVSTLRIRTPLLGTAAAVLLAVSPVTQAVDNVRYDDASFGTMILDGTVARPLGFCAMVVGSVAWVVTLPFSALGGNVRDAAQELVVKPARFTFTRPLGEL